MGEYAVAGMQPPPGCWRTLQINQIDRIAQVIEKGDVSLKPTRMARFPAWSDEKKARAKPGYPELGWLAISTAASL